MNKTLLSSPLLNSSSEITEVILIELIQDKIFKPLLNNLSITHEEVERQISKFYSKLGNVRDGFSHIQRDDQSAYIEHQKQVIYLMLKYSENPTFEKVLVLLEHDTIEDTSTTTTGMREQYPDDIVFCVALMSKKPFFEYISDSEDLKIFNKIRARGILNTKNTLKSTFCYKEKFKNDELDENEREAYEEYEKLREEYKTERNQDYCEKISSFELLQQEANSINNEYNFGYSDEEIRNLCLKTIECKLWDRIHGIITLENCSFNKIRRKIEETEKYFLPMAKIFYPEIYKILLNEIKKAKEMLFDKIYNKIKGNTRKITKQIEFVF